MKIISYEDLLKEPEVKKAVDAFRKVRGRPPLEDKDGKKPSQDDLFNPKGV